MIGVKIPNRENTAGYSRFRVRRCDDKLWKTGINNWSNASPKNERNHVYGRESVFLLTCNTRCNINRDFY